MSGEWRHAGGGLGPVCWVRDDDDRYFCDCITPTPDPTSPCGECGQPLAASHHQHVALGTPVGSRTGAHFHVPTRCTCGHPIERVP